MSPVSIILRMTEGSFKGKEYVFEDPGPYLIGRTEDCDIQLQAALGHTDVSRRHCLIEITPAGVRVRDLGSLNGTFVNGKNIGQRPRHCSPEAAGLDSSAAEELKDGDEIKVGGTAFRVTVVHSAEERAVEPLRHEAAR